MRNIKYVVNEDKRMVVGILNKIECMNLREELDARLPKSLKDLFCPFWIPQNIDIDGVGDKEFKGKAVALAMDDFDVGIGKKIAGLKIDYKYHVLMMKRYKYLMKMMKKLLNECKRLEREHFAYAVKCDYELNKYE